MLKIGDFSKICQVTIKTLRYYDRIGLLQPAEVDKFTGHRYYTMQQVPRLNRILALKDMGLSLDEIKQVMDEDLSAQEIRGMLRLKQAELRAEVAATQARLHRVQARINLIEQEGNMPQYDVVLKSIPTQRVLSIRETVATADEIAPLFAEVGDALKAHKIKADGSWMAFFHHDGFRDTNMDIEIAVPVAASVKQDVPLDDDRKLTIRETETHEKVATVVEDGNNESWSGSYTALGQFIESNQYEKAGAVREVYLTTPDDENGWMVEIQFPVKPKV